MGKLTYHIVLLLAMGLHSACAVTPDSTRSRRWYLPDYVPLQFAGNTGLVSAGLGYTASNGWYELNLLYGYAPKSVAGTYVHTITAKNNFTFGRFALQNNESLIPYIGLGISVDVGGNAFFKMPSHYPESYYDFPKNLHAIGFAGLKLQHLSANDNSLFRGIELYAEAGTIDVYVWYKINSDQIKLREIFSLALGVNFLLDK